ncbi:unnamed protein product [Rotaria magnacalcarata]|uniref:Uncharacterized protein n=2 Tax=Rotaria magnacalcarata TaxID=392030 RepID=A0A820CL80_9BILA|nr:unnamed protein product [Rotaria magnacalcarata]CAF4208974.1 unnamed protein product [Rotaria magnacalcarata]CAF4219549.1 unnamed protein product [Rotaria magnacalcarata]
MANNWVKTPTSNLTNWQIFTNNGHFNSPLPPSQRLTNRCVYHTIGSDVNNIRHHCRSARSRSQSAFDTSIVRVRSARYVTYNGVPQSQPGSVLCLGSCSTAFTEIALPTGLFNDTTIFPLWDDLYIYASASQEIYYQTDGQAPNRTLTFEYYMSHYSQPTQFY